MPSVLFLIRIKFKVQMCNNSHNRVPGTFVVRSQTGMVKGLVTQQHSA